VLPVALDESSGLGDLALVERLDRIVAIRDASKEREFSIDSILRLRAVLVR